MPHPSQPDRSEQHTPGLLLVVTARCPLSLLEDDQELEDEDEESESEEPEPEPEPESESESESDEASFFGSAAITVVDAFAAAWLLPFVVS